MDYNIGTFFTNEECTEILEHCMKNGEIFFYDPKENWDCRRMYDESFKENIFNKFKEYYQTEKSNHWFDFNECNDKSINISLTRYYDGRFLNLHRDLPSQLTTVIVLTDNFSDGRFVLSETLGNSITDMCETSTKLDIKIGDGISFDGSKIYHGVMPVYTGVRCALNVWMTNKEINYCKLKNNKTLL
jgi:hypothetical protein